MTSFPPSASDGQDGCLCPFVSCPAAGSGTFFLAPEELTTRVLIKRVKGIEVVKSPEEAVSKILELI